MVGVIRNLGHEISHQTVANILKQHDLAPAPERGNHQGKDNVILFPAPADWIGSSSGKIQSRERLGGLLRFYRREAA